MPDWTMPKAGQIAETTFSRFKLLRQIGQGGAGCVWEAECSDATGRVTKFAVKILDARLANDESRRRRFKNEALFGQRARHTNIIEVVDHGLLQEAEAPRPFIVMPLFEGTFRSLLSSKASHDERLKAFGAIMDGVEAAHLLEVVHRDLKPENVLIADNGRRVVLADFGIAHFTDEDLYTAVETRNSDRLANFQYAAPEQRKRGGRVDQTTDIYALGLILNEMFTGEIPQGTGFRTITATSPAHAWLDDIVAHMIRQSPEERPRSIDVVRNRFRAEGQAFGERQRLSEINGIVVKAGEEDDPRAVEGMSIKGVQWIDDFLIFTLSHPVTPEWKKAFLTFHFRECVALAEPCHFRFDHDKAHVRASESVAQQVYDYMKRWLPDVTAKFRSMRKQERDAKARDAEERLRREKAAIEQRQRVNSSLKP